MKLERTLRAGAARVPAGCPGDRYCEVLSAAGFALADYRARIPETDVDVDIIATGAAGISFFILCVPQRRDGLARINGEAGLRSALAGCRRLRQIGLGPNLILAERGFPGAWIQAALHEVDREELYDLVSLDADLRRLRWLARAEEDALRADIVRRPGLAALLAQRQRRLSGPARPGLSRSGPAAGAGMRASWS